MLDEHVQSGVWIASYDFLYGALWEDWNQDEDVWFVGNGVVDQKRCVDGEFHCHEFGGTISWTDMLFMNDRFIRLS